ncbi:hypothetical protein J6590_059024 [Homalodisca vitripennis]|nr:hypothetical protein J6590_059024 [Homalodisca vitripennis]
MVFLFGYEDSPDGLICLASQYQMPDEDLSDDGACYISGCTKGRQTTRDSGSNDPHMSIPELP